MEIISKFFLLIIFAFPLNAFGQKTINTELKETKTSETECISSLCEILRKEREYNEAFISPSAESVDRLHTDDFFTTSENPARTTSKTDILNYLRSCFKTQDIRSIDYQFINLNKISCEQKISD